MIACISYTQRTRLRRFTTSHLRGFSIPASLATMASARVHHLAVGFFCGFSYRLFSVQNVCRRLFNTYSKQKHHTFKNTEPDSTSLCTRYSRQSLSHRHQSTLRHRNSSEIRKLTSTSLQTQFSDNFSRPLRTPSECRSKNFLFSLLTILPRPTSSSM